MQHHRQNRAIFVVVMLCVALGAILVFRPVALAPDQTRPSLPQQALTNKDGGSFSSAPAASDLLPAAEALVGITRRAVRDILQVHDGYLPAMTAVQTCYESLPADDRDQALYCLQLDRAAWLVQGFAPSAFKAQDRLKTQFFEDEPFAARQRLHVVVLLPAPQDRTVRDGVFRQLQHVIEGVFEEEFHPESPQAPRLQSPVQN